MFNRFTLIAALVIILGLVGALLLPHSHERAPNISHIMAEDPGERHNLIGQNPEKLAELITLAAPFQAQND